MTASLSLWLDGLSSVQLALVCCLFFIAITLIGIALIHPLMRRLIHVTRLRLPKGRRVERKFQSIICPPAC
jgi:hypothetical protein